MRHLVALLLLLLLFRGDVICSEAQSRDGFVSVRGSHFVLNGYPFYANGFNAYWLMTVASDSSQRYKVTSAFEQASRYGLTVARTWAFSDGGNGALQYSPGNYNEQMFKDALQSEKQKTHMAHKAYAETQRRNENLVKKLEDSERKVGQLQNGQLQNSLQKRDMTPRRKTR